MAMAPDRVEDLVSREHATGCAGEEGQHAEGLGLQRLLDSGPQQPMAGEVDGHVVEGQRCRVVRFHALHSGDRHLQAYENRCPRRPQAFPKLSKRSPAVASRPAAPCSRV